MSEKNTRNLRMLPINDEFLVDTVAYSRWVRSEAEDADTYVRRRKVIDLAQIVRSVIENDLTESQRTMIRMHYFENLSVTQIADKTQVSLSSVVKTIRRAEENIRHAVQYVVQYQYDMRNMTVLPCAVREALVTAAGRYGRGTDVADRLRRLREGECLSLSAVSAGTHIPQERLQALEEGKSLPDCGELIRLSAYYDVTTDSILKGVSA